MSAASIYEGQTTLIPVVNALGNVFEEWQIATAGQTIFNLLSFQYTPGTNTLLVFKNGLFQRVGFDYTETNSTRVTFLAATSLNDKIAFFAWATQGVAIPNGGGLPAGGTIGQVPAKLSGNDYDVGWISVSAIAGLLDKPVQAIVAANTVDLTPYSLTTRNINISGSVSIAGFQLPSGQLWSVKVSGAFTLTNSANLVCPGNQNISARSGDSFFLRAFADNQVELIGYSKAQETVTPAGQCRLLRNGAVLQLVRYAGQSLWINGSNEQIPAAGVSLAITGTAANTSYYIYAAMIAGVMTLEFSATGYSVDGYGVQVKIGDVTRTLVGMARTIAGPSWQDTNTQRFTISYYNRRNIVLGPKVLATNAGIFSNGVYIAIPGQVTLLEFLTWVEEAVTLDFNGTMTTNVANNTLSMLSVDAANTDAYDGASMVTVGNLYPVHLKYSNNLTEGYHTAEIYSQQNAVATATYTGSATPGLRCVHGGMLRG